MISEWELWACANQILKIHGDKSSLYIAEQIGALALAGDHDGIDTWKAIAHRLAGLLGLDTAPGSPN